jgi:hypothetical protein
VKRMLLLVGCAAIALGNLSGCSDSVVASAPDETPPPTATSTRMAGRAAAPATVDSMANVALNDRDLGNIRGGLSISSGLIVNFAFQEATYVNHDLVQNIVIPTMTVSAGSGMANVGGVTVPGSVGNFSPNAVAGIGNAAAQMPVTSPGLAVQSIVNNGMTAVVSSLGGGGVSNLIANTANNQLVQQVINANIDVSGLPNTIQQGVASTVLNRVQAATSQFR